MKARLVLAAVLFFTVTTSCGEEERMCRTNQAESWCEGNVRKYCSQTDAFVPPSTPKVEDCASQGKRCVEENGGASCE